MIMNMIRTPIPNNAGDTGPNVDKNQEESRAPKEEMDHKVGEDEEEFKEK
jgi:hypothetical protein